MFKAICQIQTRWCVPDEGDFEQIQYQGSQVSTTKTPTNEISKTSSASGQHNRKREVKAKSIFEMG